ncbi:MAG TPA: Spy/CpxP family protein refolding chaperone [Bacteroidia bacterium]|jgi:protein CpxP|nr:Spy/CpxP family protein refolding chaperone [Bacteroidia bacterium]
MNNTRLLKMIIVFLLLVNIGALAFTWIGYKKNTEHRPHRGGSAFEFLKRELNLTEEQQQKLEEMRIAHHDEAEKVHEMAGPMHRRFFHLLDRNDTTAVALLADSMAQCQRQMELLTFKHFKRVREMCNPQQQQKFDEVIQEALRMMAPPRPGEPPSEEK